ncbi:hypothetical protein JMJ77_0002470 [Colletotrichum scovillei]|uniref:Uncharacterized protein n=1 Tax=Colletotrichum scovillei TaxID=1209932 RepID=A0A9P7R815_9PEZI|nr:hypothetical protein JMJ77_0002470 [Colletotrichum scovillei]KAG7070890.1 hypothetical protein JMJ76_0002133 [Colletotrichum scovillei]KAG7079132.1 hypothetical protein JMJ78_0002792 [Colletotrichum scovillei]
MSASVEVSQKSLRTSGDVESLPNIPAHPAQAASFEISTGVLAGVSVGVAWELKETSYMMVADY